MKRDPVLYVLVAGLTMFAGAFGLIACSSTPSGPAPARDAAAFASCKAAADAGYHDMKRGADGYSAKLDGDGDGVACDQKAPAMTFEECQASATSPGGGQYAVEFDNGVCKVQKP